MARTQTPAAERAVQRARAKAEEEAAAGRALTHREVAATRRGARESFTDFIPKPDAEVDLEALEERLIHLGNAAVRVEDMRVRKGSVVTLSVVTTVDYINVLTRASLVHANPLFCAFFELDRGIDFEDADEDDGDAAG